MQQFLAPDVLFLTGTKRTVTILNTRNVLIFEPIALDFFFFFFFFFQKSKIVQVFSDLVLLYFFYYKIVFGLGHISVTSAGSTVLTAYSCYYRYVSLKMM